MKGCPESPGVDVKFHAPNLAQYSNGGDPTGCSDQLIAIYDQSQSNVWAAPTTTNLGTQNLPLSLTLAPWSMNVLILK